MQLKLLCYFCKHLNANWYDKYNFFQGIVIFIQTERIREKPIYQWCKTRDQISHLPPLVMVSKLKAILVYVKVCLPILFLIQIFNFICIAQSVDKSCLQVIAAYTKAGLNPSFLNDLESSMRYVLDADGSARTYNAYEKDIAVVQFYFKKSTVVQMGTQATMTWVDYFSAVGGLLGLVLGMGIVSFIEILWLCLRLIARTMKLTFWISWIRIFVSVKISLNII